ncbi:MAG: zf-HC2 domain-containing protein [Chloroflexi bacterium]|nr:zf-HC2 domain-containing protein [Chloroflexota bacterium]
MTSRFFRMFRGRDPNGSEDDPCEPADCAKVRHVSSDFIDGEIDANLESSIAEHLDRCPGCNIFVRTLKRTVDLLRGAPGRQAPADFRQRLQERLRNEGKS